MLHERVVQLCQNCSTCSFMKSCELYPVSCCEFRKISRLLVKAARRIETLSDAAERFSSWQPCC
ncbi:hypothetical protein HMPREF9999_01005 [Alloprevotella sp. oral taxon 473 str. F0040]|nr:hypothetical protein HMPREF9999_01005 [Alloprevotella sp. oral taxon 473 str. F0040]